MDHFLTAGTIIRITEEDIGVWPPRKAEYEAYTDGYYYLPNRDSFDVMIAAIDLAGQLHPRLEYWRDG